MLRTAKFRSFFSPVFYFILFFFSILKILYLKPLFLFFLYSSDLSILHVTWISLQFLTHGSMKRSLLKFLIDCGKSKTNSAMDLDVLFQWGQVIFSVRLKLLQNG